MIIEWTVLFHPDFEVDFGLLDEGVQDELLAHTSVLKRFGPTLGRPLVDTLSGSRFSNMKELRFAHKGGVWRFAFAFDLNRSAIVLVGGNKRGKGQSQFYKNLIRIADERFEEHLIEKFE